MQRDQPEGPRVSWCCSIRFMRYVQAFKRLITSSELDVFDCVGCPPRRCVEFTAESTQSSTCKENTVKSRTPAKPTSTLPWLVIIQKNSLLRSQAIDKVKPKWVKYTAYSLVDKREMVKREQFPLIVSGAKLQSSNGEKKKLGRNQSRCGPESRHSFRAVVINLRSTTSSLPHNMALHLESSSCEPRSRGLDHPHWLFSFPAVGHSPALSSTPPRSGIMRFIPDGK